MILRIGRSTVSNTIELTSAPRASYPRALLSPLRLLKLTGTAAALLAPTGASALAIRQSQPCTNVPNGADNNPACIPITIQNTGCSVSITPEPNGDTATFTDAVITFPVRKAQTIDLDAQPAGIWIGTSSTTNPTTFEMSPHDGDYTLFVTCESAPHGTPHDNIGG
jgi:hypothetical protein